MDDACAQPNQTAAPYDAIFFDLDGTLLPMDVPDFLERYYFHLGVLARERGFDASVMTEALNEGMRVMGDHEPGITNIVAFWDMFERRFYELEGTWADRRAIEEFFDEFYRTRFDLAGEHIVADPSAQRAVSTLAAKGYPLYLTTMPLFPREAVLARLRWAKVDAGLFARITSCENSTAVKPQVAYYYENLFIAQTEPARTLMVGNNTLDDLVCLNAGMDAYLVTDHLINTNGYNIDSVKHGTLAQFCAFAESLPPCASTTARVGDPMRSPLEDDPAGVAWARPGDRNLHPHADWEDTL